MCPYRVFPCRFVGRSVTSVGGYPIGNWEFPFGKCRSCMAMHEGLISGAPWVIQCILSLKHWRIQGGAPPPNGIQFFRFRILFHQKVPILEVSAPTNTRRPPLNGKSWIRHCERWDSTSWLQKTRYHGCRQTNNFHMIKICFRLISW